MQNSPKDIAKKAALPFDVGAKLHGDFLKGMGSLIGGKKIKLPKIARSWADNYTGNKPGEFTHRENNPAMVGTPLPESGPSKMPAHPGVATPPGFHDGSIKHEDVPPPAASQTSTVAGGGPVPFPPGPGAAPVAPPSPSMAGTMGRVGLAELFRSGRTLPRPNVQPGRFRPGIV